MNILISGISGFMGNEVLKLAENSYRGMCAAAGVDIKANADDFDIPVYKTFDNITSPDDFDAIVDFSNHAITESLTSYAVKNKKALIIATTGHTAGELEMIKKASQKIPVFHAANFSLGIALLIELAKKTAESMPDAEIEIIEKHHDRKLDAPSGTALAIAEGIKEIRPASTFNLGRSGNGKRTFDEIGIHAIRMGNIVGEHEVIVGTQNQTITLKHEAHSRALFAEGALAAAEFIHGKPAGLYNMKSMIG